MELPTKLISFGVTAVTALAGLYGGATFTHDKLQQIDSMQGDITLVSERLEQKILTDRYALLQQRAWKIEDRYSIELKDAPETVREEYRQIKAEMDALDQELNRVTSEYKEQGKALNRYYDRKRGSNPP